MTKAATIILKPLPDEALAACFEQAVINRLRGEDYIHGLRRYTRLIEIELQAQIYRTAHQRAYDAGRREKRRNAGVVAEIAETS